MDHNKTQRLILQTTHDAQPSPGVGIKDSFIVGKIGLPIQDVRDRLELLEEEDKVMLSKLLSGEVSVFLKPRGRLALKENPQQESGQPSFNHEINMLPKRIFVTHGRSLDWYEVQRYIEKTICVETLELSEEPFQGRTILQKLNEESKKCGYAVIVMTGDDHAGENEVRARENVIHEIGFFQGRYGLDRVCLVYEQGVNIPSNFSGLGYIRFSKGEIRATFADLRKEIESAFNQQG